MKCSEALDLFIREQYVAGSTDKTIKHYRTHINLFINFVNNIDIDLIDYDIYKDYIVFLKTKYKDSQVSKGQKVHLAGRTIKTYASALKTFLSFCYSKIKVLPEDIAQNIKMPKYQKKVIKILNYEQIKKIISYYDINTFLGCRDLLAISLMLDCGLRVSEVAEVSFSDFDLINRCIVVNGKGQKQRYVPFTDFVFDLYNKLLKLSNFDYPFCDVYGNKLKVNGIIQIVKRLKIGLGFKDLHPHLFRHTFATLYILNGGDPLSLQIILGHTTFYMTQQYLHLAQQLVISKNIKFTPLSHLKTISS